MGGVKNKKMDANFKRARAAIGRGDFDGAIEIANKLIEVQPDNVDFLMLRGEAYIRGEYYEASVSDYARAVTLDEKNVGALNNFGAALIRCNRQIEAQHILQYVLELQPDSFDAHINLCNIMQSLGKPEESLKIAFRAIELRPGSALAYNNLGTALGDLYLVNEAREAYITANLIDPLYMPTIINLAQIEEKLENREAAIRLYEAALHQKQITKDQADLIRYYLSYSYLFQGRLDIGWQYYEHGFCPLLPIGGLRSLRRFNQAQWNGDSLAGKRILVWREQGLGDEIEFSSCLADLQDSGASVIYECDPRLVSIYQRSFPWLTARAEGVGEDRYPLYQDFDLHCPVGSLPNLLRRRLEDFPRTPLGLQPSEESISFVRGKLAPWANKKLVGICWRSGKLSIERNRNYTGLLDWEEILNVPNIQFVNLQYGECEEELKAVEEALSIHILRWPDLDLKNDLDKVLALIGELDNVVTVGTAVSSLAAAVGTETLLLTKKTWMLLGQEEHYPWFASMKLFVAAQGEQVASRIADVAVTLRSKLGVKH